MLRCHCSFLETPRRGNAMRIGTDYRCVISGRRKSSLCLYRKKSDRNVCCLGSDMHGDPSHCPKVGRYCSSDGWCRQGLIVVTKDCLSFPPACIEEYQLWGNLEKPPQHGFTLYKHASSIC